MVLEPPLLQDHRRYEGAGPTTTTTTNTITTITTTTTTKTSTIMSTVK